jgi:arylsulfatase A-like enzyme
MTSSFVGATYREVSLCVCAIAMSLSLSCSDDSPEPRRPRGAVLILLDTVRADHVSSYGYTRATTPAIDALAERGVLFERVVSSAPWTLPSVGALLAGRSPPLAFDQDSKLAVSLVERIQDAGFVTGAVTEGGFVSEHFNMDRGFASYSEERSPVRVASGDDSAPGEDGVAPCVARVFTQAKDWLRENGSEPFFLLVHTYEAHTPYVDATFAQGMRPGRMGPELKIAYLAALQSGRIRLTPQEQAYGTALYDGDIHVADRYVGELLGYLEELGIAKETLVVVTSDHGEELGGGFEHGIFDHGHSLRDDQLLVPLVLFDPTRDFPDDRITQQVRLIDVVPTVCDLLGVEPDPRATGRSLVPVLEGTEKLDRVAFSSSTSRGPVRVSISDGRYKLIRVLAPATGPIEAFPEGVDVPEIQLFDLQSDPAETTNLAAQMPGLVQELSRDLERWRSEIHDGMVELLPTVDDEELRARLNSLGY